MLFIFHCFFLFFDLMEKCFVSCYKGSLLKLQTSYRGVTDDYRRVTNEYRRVTDEYRRVTDEHR